jgi:hypothetical protein
MNSKEPYLRHCYDFVGSCGFFNAGSGFDPKPHVAINPEKCANVGKFSFPGAVCDRTPYGVIQHELGHYMAHLDFRLKNLRRETTDKPITSYCPNNEEWFAEMHRLFVTNSELLRTIRPDTYFYMTRVNLKPVRFGLWEEELIKFNVSEERIKRIKARWCIA